MPAVRIEFGNDAFDRFDELLKHGFSASQIRQQSYIAVNQVAKEHKTSIAKQIREKVTLMSSIAKESIGFNRAKKGETSVATIVIRKSKRPPLSAFTHTVKKVTGWRKKGVGGVSVKVSQSSGRTLIGDAFTVQKYRSASPALRAKGKGDLFVRYPRGENKNYKVVRLWGVSVWGVFVKNKMQPRTEDEIRERLDKRIRRNIERAIFKKMKG